MNTYELINPSDAITFKAENDQIAYATCLMVGQGLYGAERIEDGHKVNVPAFLVQTKNAPEHMKNYLGMDPEEFMKIHKNEIVASCASFMYGTLEIREAIDSSMNALTDPQAKKEFLIAHEEAHRTSLNKIVAKAWIIGRKFGEDAK